MLKSIPPEVSANFLGLNHDVAALILRSLEIKDLLKCALVCKSWKRRVRDSGLTVGIKIDSQKLCGERDLNKISRSFSPLILTIFLI